MAVNEHDYPRFQFITYAYDDPDEAPVLDVSRSIEEARQQDHAGGFLYRVERLPESEWASTTPEYGNDEFVECIAAGESED